MLNKIIKKLEDAKEYFGSPMITIDDAIKIIKQHESEFEDAIEQWDEAYQKADTYLKTEHPIGKIIGYHHDMLIEYLKEHYTISPKL